MTAKKECRMQAGFEDVHALAEQKWTSFRTATAVKAHIIRCGFNPFDFLHRNDCGASMIADDETCEWRVTAGCFGFVLDGIAECARFANALRSVLDGGRESLGRHWFEDVIERAGAESTDGMSIVRGDEYHRRRNIFRLQPLERRKTVELRHGNIEKQNVGAVLDNRVAGVVSVRAFRDHGYAGYILEEQAQSLACQRLIINH
jgi:hypothetical protein